VEASTSVVKLKTAMSQKEHKGIENWNYSIAKLEKANDI